MHAAASYFSSTYRSVRGFLTQGSAFALLTILEVQRRDAVGGPIAEIGTFHGTSLVGFGLAALEGEVVLGVDLLEHHGEDFEAALRGNWRRFGLPDERLRLHRGSSGALDAGQWAALLGAPARLVHVDGEHSYRAAAHDLDLAASCLVAEGVIVVDDVLHPWYPDITLAAGDFLRRNPDFRAFALVDRGADLMRGGAKLFIARHSEVARYAAAFRFCLPGNIVGMAAFAGSTLQVLAFRDDDRKRILPIP